MQQLMRIVCLGDSFTQGFGVEEQECWVSLLNREMPWEFVNKGVNGDTTTGLLARFHRDVVEEKPRYVFLDDGFNDFLAGAERGGVQANMMSLVHQAYHNNIVPVVLMIPAGNAKQFKQHWPAFIDIDRVQAEYEAYRAWLKSFCRGFSLFYIDCYEVADNADFADHKYLDGIHMTPAGHADIAAYIIKFLEKAVH